jgi:hypothetical protein
MRRVEPGKHVLPFQNLHLAAVRTRDIRILLRAVEKASRNAAPGRDRAQAVLAFLVENRVRAVSRPGRKTQAVQDRRKGDGPGWSAAESIARCEQKARAFDSHEHARSGMDREWLPCLMA